MDHVPENVIKVQYRLWRLDVDRYVFTAKLVALKANGTQAALLVWGTDIPRINQSPFFENWQI
jgi:hypothetical protein